MKKRTGSALRQGLMPGGALPRMKLDKLEPLMAKFGPMLRARPDFREVFGLA